MKTPNSYRVHATFTLSPQAVECLDQYAKAANLSKSRFLEKCLLDFIPDHFAGSDAAMADKVSELERCRGMLVQERLRACQLLSRLHQQLKKIADSTAVLAFTFSSDRGKKPGETNEDFRSRLLAWDPSSVLDDLQIPPPQAKLTPP